MMCFLDCILKKLIIANRSLFAPVTELALWFGIYPQAEGSGVSGESGTWVPVQSVHAPLCKERG